MADDNAPATPARSNWEQVNRLLAMLDESPGPAAYKDPGSREMVIAEVTARCLFEIAEDAKYRDA